MNWSACRWYDTKEEENDGAYWKLLNQSIEDFKNNISIYAFAEIAKNVRNQELKQKLKEKFIEVYGHEALYEMKSIASPDIYSEEEMKSYTEEAIKIVKNKYINNTSMQGKKSLIDYNIIAVIQCVADVEWQREKINEVLFFIKSNENLYPKLAVEELITQLVHRIKNKNIKEDALNQYSEYISQEFKHYYEVINDEHYIAKKAENYKNIRIGLNPKLQIGLEIEANRNLFKNPWIYNQKNLGGYWSAIDMSVADGAEFVTPIFHDTPEEVSKVCALCETIKQMGFIYDENLKNASGQINIGLKYLDTVDAILNFFEVYGNCEELLFYISNEEGQLPRKNIYENKYAKPFSGELGKIKIDEEISRDDLIKMFTPAEDYITLERLDEEESKYDLKLEGLKIEKPTVSNLSAFHFKKNTVCLRDGNRLEFRIPNTSVDYKVWIDNIRLYGRIVEVSKELADIMEKGDVSSKEIKKLELKEELKSEEKTLEEKLFVLMDLLFEDDKIKKIYMDRFYCLQRKIKETHASEYTKPNESDSKGFGVVEFQRMYRTRVYENRGPIALYNPGKENLEIENKNEI